MKEAEVALVFEQFKNEVASWTDEQLLDAWIAHQDKEVVVPDIDLLKSTHMEALLIEKYGLMNWQGVVATRRQVKNA